MLLEPVQLDGEGEYNLNVLKEIKVSDSFLGLDPEVRQCQNEEPFHNCTTRKHVDTFLMECNCLPFNIRVNKEVANMKKELKCKITV